VCCTSSYGASTYMPCVINHQASSTQQRSVCRRCHPSSKRLLQGSMTPCSICTTVGAATRSLVSQHQTCAQLDTSKSSDARGVHCQAITAPTCPRTSPHNSRLSTSLKDIAVDATGWSPLICLRPFKNCMQALKPWVQLAHNEPTTFLQ